MKLIMITLYDAKAEAYNAPQFVQSIGGAIRAFSDEINRPEAGNVLHSHPDDFLLYEMGTYNDGDASIELTLPLRLIASGIDHKRS